jgi:uncharacterized protein (TIGR02757 family)
MNDDLHAFLEEKYQQYHQPFFIETDPVQVPALFAGKENQEIAGFLASTIAWGQRPTIIRNASRLMTLMENNPYDFLMNTSEKDWTAFLDFKHRTFNGVDAIFFLKSLQHIYMQEGGLEQVFTNGFEKGKTVFSALAHFRTLFFKPEHPARTEKHLSDVQKGASAKRLNMFLRWMVRPAEQGIDFGLWKGIPTSALMLPLDIHTGRVARRLGLLTRRQNDWQAVEEVTARLREFDPNDPIKYDFALFGLGIFEKFA